MMSVQLRNNSATTNPTAAATATAAVAVATTSESNNDNVPVPNSSFKDLLGKWSTRDSLTEDMQSPDIARLACRKKHGAAPPAYMKRRRSSVKATSAEQRGHKPQQENACAASTSSTAESLSVSSFNEDTPNAGHQQQQQHPSNGNGNGNAAPKMVTARSHEKPSPPTTSTPFSMRKSTGFLQKNKLTSPSAAPAIKRSSANAASPKQASQIRNMILRFDSSHQPQTNETLTMGSYHATNLANGNEDQDDAESIAGESVAAEGKPSRPTMMSPVSRRSSAKSIATMKSPRQDRVSANGSPTVKAASRRRSSVQQAIAMFDSASTHTRASSTVRRSAVTTSPTTSAPRPVSPSQPVTETSAAPSPPSRTIETTNATPSSPTKVHHHDVNGNAGESNAGKQQTTSLKDAVSKFETGTVAIRDGSDKTSSNGKDATAKATKRVTTTKTFTEAAAPLKNARDRVRKRNERRRTKKKTKMGNICAKRLSDVSASNLHISSTPKSDEDVQMIQQALRKNFIFQSMEQAELDQLVGAFELTKPFADGDVIIQQGDKGDYFYVIADGCVDYEVNGNKVGEACSGASFGELALLYTCPRAATVRSAKDATKLFRVEQTTFRYILQTQTKASQSQKMQLLKGVSFLSDLSAADLNRLSAVMTPRHFEAGDYIMYKGEIGDAFYIVQDGKLRVTDISVGATKYEDVDLGAGDSFGERALLTSEPRAANVVGTSDGTVFSIDRATFDKVCGSLSWLILKAQDKRRLLGIKAIQDADLEPAVLDELVRCIDDDVFYNGSNIFAEGEKTEAALYLVREGEAEIVTSNNANDNSSRSSASASSGNSLSNCIIQEGGFFGDEQLLSDANRPPTDKSTNVVAKYTATVQSDILVCGVLSLTECRKFFDTKTMGQSSAFGDFGEVQMMRSHRRSSVQSNITVDDLKRHSILGEGQFGEVWLVSADLGAGAIDDEPIEENFALKIQSKSDESRSAVSATEAIRREIELLSLMNHPFIVDLVHQYEDDSNFFMLMGLVKGGELWSIIHREDDDGEWLSGIGEHQASFYALLVADTLAYMHRQNVCFRDLKPENILIDDEGYPIVVDFGFAKHVPDKTFTLCGTPNYLAPEMIQNRGHDFAVDNWTLGVVIYEMLTGENPFYYEGIDDISLFRDICQEEPYPLPDTVSPEAKDIIKKLLVKDPSQRIGSLARGVRDILEHEWFSPWDLPAARMKQVKAPYLPKCEVKQ